MTKKYRQNYNHVSLNTGRKEHLWVFYESPGLLRDTAANVIGLRSGEKQNA